MTHDTAKAAEWGAYGFAGIAAISLSQAALVLTVIATLLSIALGCIRLHDRLKYGPVNRGRGE